MYLGFLKIKKVNNNNSGKKEIKGVREEFLGLVFIEGFKEIIQMKEVGVGWCKGFGVDFSLLDGGDRVERQVGSIVEVSRMYRYLDFVEIGKFELRRVAI